MNRATLLTRITGSVRPLIEFGLLFLAGSFITLSLAPFNIWPLALVSLLLFHYALMDATLRQAIWRSLYFGCGLFFPGVFWIYVSIHEHGGASPFLAGFMTTGFCLFMSSWMIPFGLFFSRFLRRAPGGPTIGFAAVWMLGEWVRIWLLTGFPWLFAGYSQLNGPLAGWAPVIGTLGISFILAYTASVISESLFHQKVKKPVWHFPVVLLLWLAPLYLSAIEWTHPKTGKAYSVALLQPNQDLEGKWDPENRDLIMEEYRNITLALGDQDLVIWPETAIPQTYHNALDYLREIDEFARQSDTAIILGIPSRWSNGSDAIYHNTLVGIGKAEGMYHKQKLVPFGEYVPLESMLRGLIKFFDLPMSYFSPGPADQPPIKAKDLLIMPYICYEVVYPDFVSGTAGSADLLVTVSNDAWFGESIGPIQHLQMAQMRSLENGRYMLRDTNNGVTAVIDHKGKIIAELPQFEAGVLKARVYAHEGLTPVAQYGTLPAVIFSFAILIFLLAYPKIRSLQS